MINFEDAFGRNTMIEILPTPYNKRIGIVIRKERQTIYESMGLELAKKLAEELQTTIRMMEDESRNN